MLKNYLVTSFRSIWRNRGYAFLHIAGLTLSIAACLVIFLVVRHELGYDGFHRKASRIYRVTMQALDYNPSVSMAVAPALRTDFPELEQVSQAWYRQSAEVKVRNNRYMEKEFVYADEHFLRVFDYQWLAGNPQTALAEPNTVVLTETLARRYFGKADAMGQLIHFNNRYNLRVTGVIRDLPGNTHLPFLFLVSFETLKQEINAATDNFYNIRGGFTYIVVPERYDIGRMERRLPAFIEKHWGAEIAKEASLLLQPLRDIHFDRRYLQNPASVATSRETYWALALVAVFIIVTACINFINMATAQAARRAREVGVRKTLGATRLQLVRQFLGETTLLVIPALLLGYIAAYTMLPVLGRWLDVRIDNGQLLQPVIPALLLLLAIVIILLAGLYPAFVQSSFRPVLALKSNTGVGFGGLKLRKALVLVQFVISQMLIVGTLVAAKQMDFFRNRDLGFDKTAVITFNLPDGDRRESLRQQLLADAGVRELCFSSGAPSYNSSYAPYRAPEMGITENAVTELKFIDEQYIRMFNMKMLAGEPVTKREQPDSVPRVVVNETLLQGLGIQRPEDAIGKHFTAAGERSLITGVIQDFQSESKHKKRRPCVLLYRPGNFFAASVRLRSTDTYATIERIGKIWAGLFPDNIFSYEFLDDHIASFYKQEQKTYTAFRLFSALAILIGCLGLYGLVAMAAVQRTKEMGIRKVMGASVPHIVGLFAKEFIWLIAGAFLVAAPLAYYVMHNWLQHFAYQVNLGGGTFLAGIAVSFLVAVLTIAHQAVKAALVNPVKSLKAES